jgi:Zn-dependent metalloprotease
MHRRRKGLLRVLIAASAAWGTIALSSCASPEQSETADTRSALSDEDKKAIEKAIEYLQSKGRTVGVDPGRLTAREHVFHDLVGGRHVWFRHAVDGARVLGSEIVVHLDARNTVTGTTNALVRDLETLGAPRFSAGEAIKRARALVGAPDDARVKRAELVFDPRSRRLAFDVELRFVNRQTPLPTMTGPEVLLDARSLELIRTWSSLRSDALPMTGHGQYAGDVTVTVDQQLDGTVELRDVTRGDMVVVNGAACAEATSNIYDGPVYTTDGPDLGDGQPFYSVDHAFIPAPPLASYFDTFTTPLHPDCAAITHSPNGETAPVDILHHHAVVYDMFENVFGRVGTDGMNKPLKTIAHLDYPLFPFSPINAFWDEDCDEITAGEQQCSGYFTFFGGDGCPDPGYPAILALLGLTDVTGIESADVVAHEFTHGVTYYTAGLEYEHDAGGLNESYSDVFGTMAEFYLLGGAFDTEATSIPNAAAGADFELAEDIGPGFILRSMTRPSSVGRGFEADTSFDAWSAASSFANGDPHVVSGAGNRAFRFLAQGATGTSTETFTPLLPDGLVGIGNDLAARLWYQALAYLTPASNYIDMRAAVVQAAVDLGHPPGSSVQTQIALAFDAINVGDAHLPNPSYFVAGDVEPNDGVGNAGLATIAPDVRITADIDSINFIDDDLIAGTVGPSDSVDLYTFYVEAGADRVIVIDAPCEGKVDGTDPLVVRVHSADGHPATRPDGVKTTDPYVVACGSVSIPIHNYAEGQGTGVGDPAIAFRSAFFVSVSLAADGEAPTRPYNLEVGEIALEAVFDSYTLGFGQTSIVVPTTTGIMANDVFVPGTTPNIVDYPDLGGLTMNADGSFSYSVYASPLPTFSQSDTFRYALQYGSVTSNEADVMLTIRGRFPFIRIFPLWWRPYIYRGCPEPGPEPWREIQEILVDKQARGIEVVFASAVPLGIRVEQSGRGSVKIGERNQLIYMPPREGFQTERLYVALEDRSCNVVHEATVTFTAAR